MKKKIGFGIGILLIILIIASVLTNYIDSANVTTGHEPKYCIKIVNNNGSKVTYWGLGYKVIRYVGVSPKEPYESNIGVKMGSWFMKYELPNEQDEQNEKSFFGKIVEFKTSYIIVEPNEFEILFYDKHPMESYKTYTILDKSETDKYDYTTYGYDGTVNIRIDGKEYSLKEALLENKITMDEIIAKANKDLAEEKITGDMYKDGGSMIYQYSNYTIIKCHTLDGNRDVYIGTKNMTINDIYK